MNIQSLIAELLRYGKKTGLVDPADEIYVQNRLLEFFSLPEPGEEPLSDEERPLFEILSDVCDYARDRGMLEDDTVTYRDLFDTKVMGILTPAPSAVIRRFNELYEKDPEAATDYFYHLSCDANYIRTDRIKKDLKWTVDSEYGKIDITVNLSKPEKDPKAIIAAKNMPQSGYPKCLLCHENEGYAGTLTKPARQNLRQIPFRMAGVPWFLQYSPYVYYNEHCIALSGEHTPMKVNAKTVEKLLCFVEHFPHYFMGSNAGLPVVGGSILAHDHMQGGRYTFAMERAEETERFSFRGFEDVEACSVKWPMPLVRIRSEKPDRVLALASRIFDAWEAYTDEEAGIFAETDGTPHNAITPIARRRGSAYEVDLVLRNNLTTEEFPLGVFHPHPEHHNIKKENIGLIEVMGLAVLPSRLKNEMALMKDAILRGIDFDEIPDIQKHKAWFEKFRDAYTFTEENTEEILKAEVGATFVRVLKDAGVFKDTEAGHRQYLRFIKFIDSYQA